jgi:hypothetical protein
MQTDIHASRGLRQMSDRCLCIDRSNVEVSQGFKICVCRNITPCSPVKVNRHFGGACRLHLQGRRIRQTRHKHEAGSQQSRWNLALIASSFILVFWLAYSYTLKMEATCSSETSVDFQQNTRRYTSEGKIIHNHYCENLKSSSPLTDLRIYQAVTFQFLWFFHVSISVTKFSI